MPGRYGQGSLKREPLRQGGASWKYRYYCIRSTDGKKVERSLVIGTTEKFPTERSAWAEVDRLRLVERARQQRFLGSATVGDIAAHYVAHELGDQSMSVRPLSHTTVDAYLRCINLRILPRWQNRIATSLKPLEIEQWLRSLKQTEGLANPTLAKTKNVFSLIFKHALRVGLIVNGEGANPLNLVRCSTVSTYEARPLTPNEAYAIWLLLPQFERLLLLLCAVTGLRVSEALGLKFSDLDHVHSCIHVRRSWTGGKIGLPKTRASRASVPLQPLLAEHFAAWRKETPYSGDDDWIFASFRLKGKQPRVANMLVEDHIRPAALKAGILKEGEDRTIGFHALRHGIATILISANTDPKTVQSMLRHSDVSTTLGIYAHANSEAKMVAQGVVLDAFFAGERALSA